MICIRVHACVMILSVCLPQLMSSVKTVLIEMLSTFDAKSRLSAKQLKEQLHTCWPVPNSRVALDQLRKELRDEMKQSLEVVSLSVLTLCMVS